MSFSQQIWTGSSGRIPINRHLFSLVVPGFVDTPTFDKSRDAARHARGDPENPYRQLMHDLDDFAVEQLKSAVSPEVVGAVIVEAATARMPKARYFVPRGARNAVRMFALMPQSVADRVLLKMYKWGPGRA